ncbi:endonuclease domain-containing protein [Hymenobacter radiodurans]|uniref:endonuclease domain-containing protein n=1 Tax=Hymenobacter radiodurans TaxID=2496028 RepID=UPI001F1034F2|nr:endonuclease domain-containing protein [Hymenobacter radiodurans]
MFTADSKGWEKTAAFAKEMRSNPTQAENVLWQALRNQKLGEKFRRQHVVNSFIVDFVCIAKMLVVEVDGDVHTEANQAEYDTGRTYDLNQLGYKVLRFSNSQVLNDLPTVLTLIQEALAGLPPRVVSPTPASQLQSSGSPLSAGEGAGG